MPAGADTTSRRVASAAQTDPRVTSVPGIAEIRGKPGESGASARRDENGTSAERGSASVSGVEADMTTAGKIMEPAIQAGSIPNCVNG